jgi:hypothetical protein
MKKMLESFPAFSVQEQLSTAGKSRIIGPGIFFAKIQLYNLRSIEIKSRKNAGSGLSTVPQQTISLEHQRSPMTVTMTQGTSLGSTRENVHLLCVFIGYICRLRGVPCRAHEIRRILSSGSCWVSQILSITHTYVLDSLHSQTLDGCLPDRC